MQTCKECKYYQAHQMGEAKATYGYCFLKPPVVILMLQDVPAPKVQTKLSGPQQATQQLLPAAVRPQVREQEYCAEWTSVQTH